MIQARTSQPRPRTLLEQHEDELAQAAEEADDPADADVFAGLVAIARGERVPRDVARRVVERAEER